MPTRKCLRLSDRFQVIEMMTVHKMCIKDVMKKYDCCKSTIYNILQKKDEIQAEYLEGGNGDQRKKRRKTGNEEINERTWKWFARMRNRNIAVSGTMLKQKAKSIATELGNEHFKASNGWLESFKTRHKIALRIINGEAESVDINDDRLWKDEIIEEISVKGTFIKTEFITEKVEETVESCEEHLPQQNEVVCVIKNEVKEEVTVREIDSNETQKEDEIGNKILQSNVTRKELIFALDTIDNYLCSSVPNSELMRSFANFRRELGITVKEKH